MQQSPATLRSKLLTTLMAKRPSNLLPTIGDYCQCCFGKLSHGSIGIRGFRVCLRDECRQWLMNREGED